MSAKSKRERRESFPLKSLIAFFFVALQMRIWLMDMEVTLDEECSKEISDDESSIESDSVLKNGMKRKKNSTYKEDLIKD